MIYWELRTISIKEIVDLNSDKIKIKVWVIIWKVIFVSNEVMKSLPRTSQDTEKYI